MTRPDHLPDFGSPPVTEVALGVQFRQPQGYQQIYAGDVWRLFRNEYPVVEEQLRLAPQYETFGPLQSQNQRPQFVVQEGAEHDRFFFISEDSQRLIQFQSDRLLHNWRRNVDGLSTYPRFEVMLSSFKKQAEELEKYVATLEPQTLEINQCELSYINQFPLEPEEGFHSIYDYLKILNPAGAHPDDVAMRYRRTISNAEGAPTGRLHFEASTGVTDKGKPMLAVNLVVRGTPAGSAIQDAVAYLCQGRELIVTEFATVTTDKAHRFWERKA